MIKLFCFPRSGNSREVKIVMAEKGLKFEPIDIHANKDVMQSPEFKKASPKGTVPAIIDGDVYMSEAYQINEYLENTYPQNPILPKDSLERAKIREWVSIYDKKLVLKIGLLLIECILKPAEQQKEETKTKLRAGILSSLKEVNDFLEKKEHIFGTFSLADISLTPHLVILPRLGVELSDEFSNVKAWINRVKNRPSFSASAEWKPGEIAVSASPR